MPKTRGLLPSTRIHIQLEPSYRRDLVERRGNPRGREEKRDKKKKRLTAQVNNGDVVAARPLLVQAPEHRGRDADWAAGAERRAATLRGSGEDAGAREGDGAEGESHFSSFGIFLQAAVSELKKSDLEKEVKKFFFLF